MKRFTENDLLISTLKVYPKVKLFVHNGSVYYNGTPQEGPQLNKFLDTSTPAGAVSAEDGTPLSTESGDYIIIE